MRAAVGAALAVALALATLAARHADPSAVSPITPRGHWSAVWTWGLVAALALYVASLLLHRVRRGGLAAAVLVATVVQVLPLAAPVLLSKDAYLYWAEARIVTVHHSSPYRSTPADFPDDPALATVSEQWRGTPAPYGPAWETLALAPAAVAGTSSRHAVSGYKLLALAGVLVALGLIAFGTRSAGAVVLLGWNPLIALHFAGGGHSDGWLVALLVAAVLARNRAAGGAAWSLAGAFKPVPIVLLPLELATTRFRRAGRFWIGLVVTATVVLAVSALVWGPGWIRASLVGVHGASPLGGVHWLTEAGLTHRDAVLVAGAAFAAIYVWLFRTAWRHGRARLGLAAAALCLTSSLLRPWYAIWPLALAAVEEDAAAGLVAAGLSIYLLLGDALSL